MRALHLIWIASSLVVFGCSKSRNGGASGEAVLVSNPPCTDVAGCTEQCKPCRAGTCPIAAARACYELAELRKQSPPDEYDMTTASIEYERACDSGYMPACNELANDLTVGLGRGRDLERAAELYQRSCDAGIGVSCRQLANLHARRILEGLKVDKQYMRAQEAKAVTLDERLCKQDPGWCLNHGKAYEDGSGVERDRARAREIYQDGCGRGATDSCLGLALLDLWRDGERTPKEMSAITTELTRLCEEGAARACSVLADIGNKGLHGTSMAPERVRELLTRACDRGDDEGCARLAVIYQKGDGVPAHLGKARTLSRRACDLGHALACLMGSAEVFDEVKSRGRSNKIELVERACHLGAEEGCYWMGLLLSDHMYAERDVARGMEYLQMACLIGHQGACDTLESSR